MQTKYHRVLCTFLVACSGGVGVASDPRVEHFDKDPGWDGRNNRSATPEARTVRQDFGFSHTSHAGGRAGEIGGFISTAAEPAYYAKKIPERSFNDVLSASGTLVCGDGPYHFLIGFFNANSLNEWRTPNSLALRIGGRGKVFYTYVEYCTGGWQAGGDNPGGFATIDNPQTGRKDLKGFATGPFVHKWALRYEPSGNGGHGFITATMDGETSVCHLDSGHKESGAVFNRFGLLNVMKSADGGGEIWLDDVTINGAMEHFEADPQWDGAGNRHTFVSTNVRPRFGFGYSPTRFAGGIGAGEMGGVVFRGDNRYPERLAYYGDRLNALSLEKPLNASGRVSFRRGVSDSTTLLGFFHSQDSVEVSPSQAQGWPKCFLGIAIEGPSREGFFFYPAYRVNGAASASAGGNDRPRIMPDAKAHSWTFAYRPASANNAAQIRVTLDQQTSSLEVSPEHANVGARFNRFGLVTTWIDGNGQHIYFDDLSYTFKQE